MRVMNRVPVTAGKKMAQPNVAREPSMEEILASIRRIIESNEPNAENLPSRSLPPVYGEEEIEAEEMGFGPDVAANDPGLPRRAEPMNLMPAPAGQQAQAEQRGLSLADVAARVRAASARQQETGSSARPAATPAPVVAPAPMARQDDPVSLRRDLPRLEMPQMPELRESLSLTSPAPAPAVEPMQQAEPFREPAPRLVPPVFNPPQPAPARMEAPLRSEPLRSEPMKPVADLAPRLPAKFEEAANLLSAEAGAQVAKSFSELAAVFNGMERRSLEDMAGDMLRPMLQEWLDDNLPTLVERLVREEIERVSRGPRR